jgi:hypothetical protein
MVFTDEATTIILKRFPDFANSKYWQECIDTFGDERTMCSVMTFFGEYIEDLIIADKLSSVKKKEIFDLAEEFMCQGDSDVQNGVATCFLEDLINCASANRIKYSDFVPFLGKESKEYCKAWDEFTGVKSEGLWESEDSDGDSLDKY